MVQRIKNKDIPDWGKLFFVTDILIVVGFSYLWFQFVYEREQLINLYVVSTIILILTSTVISFAFGVYNYWYEPSASREIRAILSAWLATIALMFMLAFFLKSGANFSRSWFGLTVVCSVLLICMSRILFRNLMSRTKGKTWNKQNIIIIGTTHHASQLATLIQEQNWVGLEITRLFHPPQSTSEKPEKMNPANSISNLNAYLEGCNSGESKNGCQINQVWIILENTQNDLINELLSILDQHSVDIVYVPNLSFFSSKKYNLSYIAGIPVITPGTSSLSISQQYLKLFEDYILALFILILVSPLMLLIGVGVKLSSPGPIFYRQKRMTLYGRHFDMLKFRSMPVGIESQSGPVWAKYGENRSTGFGSLLRRTSFDELPQFINVLKGDMSIVGPRPERPEFVEQFKKEIPGYMKKHLLKAGITGWAQVNGFRGDTSLEERINHDIFYINHWSLAFDLRIFLMTVYKGFVNKSAY